MSKLRSRLALLLEGDDTFHDNLNAFADTPAPLGRSGLASLLGSKTNVGFGEITVLPEGRGLEAHKSPNALAMSVNFAEADLAGALNVPSEVLVNGAITGNEIDFFPIALVAGETYLFSAFGSGADPLQDTILLLADPALNFISGGYSFFPELADDDGGAGTSSLFTYTATVSGTFFVGVGAFAGTGQYTLDAVQQPPTDVVSDDFAQATPLTVGQVKYGFIEAGPGPYGPPLGEVDTYSFTVEAGRVYTFEIAGGADYNSDFLNLPPGELDTVAFVYDGNGALVAFNDDISFPSDVSSRVSFFATESGTYYLDVVSYTPWTGGFSITSQSFNPADFDPLDSIIWRDASNVPFDATETAYVYFAAAGESFGELADDGESPLPSFGWNAYEMGQVMLALEEYEKILGVNYEITTDVNQATFRLITTESTQYGAYMYPQDPAFGDAQGIAAFNVLSGAWNFDQQQSLEQGGFAFAVMLHEFGHGHGLAHPHDTGGGSDVMLGVTGPFNSLGVYDLNQGVYTVMSYNDAWQLHPDGPSPFNVGEDVDNGWSGTLGALDIAALQRRYGANNAYATGNNVYQLKDANVRGTYYQTIWDTGGRDTIRYDGARNARIDLLAATIDYTPTGGGVISYVDDIWGGFTIAQGVVIENATGGQGNDGLLGNAVANVLTGNGGDDVLVGRGGGDTLNGGAGFDIASYIDASAGVRASLDTGRGSTGDAAGDVYRSIEGLQGSAHNDVLSGGDGANRLDGLGGNDSLSGGDGADILLGGDGDDTMSGGDGKDGLDGGNGNDVVSGGDGADTMLGGAGNDQLSGGDGPDTLIGGTGNDRLTGGEGPDTFAFSATDGLDTVTDFRRRQDHIDLSDTDLGWADLDTTHNGVLDDADAFVAVMAGQTVIDLGAASGAAAGLNTLTLLGAVGLTESDFLFGP